MKKKCNCEGVRVTQVSVMRGGYELVPCVCATKEAIDKDWRDFKQRLAKAKQDIGGV